VPDETADQHCGGEGQNRRGLADNNLCRLVYRHIDYLWVGLLDKNGRPIHGDRHVIIRLEVSGIVGFFPKRLDGIENVTFLHRDRVLEFRPPVFVIL